MQLVHFMLEQRKPSLALRAGPGSVASDDISQPRQREAKFSVTVTPGAERVLQVGGGSGALPREIG